MKLGLSRRVFLKGTAAAACSATLPSNAQSEAPVFVYFGTYTDPKPARKGDGIYGFRIEPGTGAVEYAGSFASAVNPSFLALHPNRRALYAVNESSPGAVSAFSANTETGALTHMNTRPSLGDRPVHLSVDPTGRFVLVANDGGTIAVFPVLSDGSLGEPTDMVRHQGPAGPRAQRQDGPHPQQIITDPAGRYALVTDLGLDKTLVYALNGDSGTLRLHSELAAEPGTGPKRIADHPLGRWMYRINELNNTMTAVEWIAATGELRNIQSLSTLPESFRGENGTGQVQVAPYGQFVYGTNLGDDSIVLFNMDAGTGELTFLALESSFGETPAFLAIDPAGSFLFAANQESDSVVQFAMNRRNGRLTATGTKLDLPAPASILFSAPPVGLSSKSGVTLSVFNNPTYIFDGTGQVRSSFAWNAPDAAEVEVRVNSPSGPLLGRFPKAAGVTTDKWVTNGTVFYLQDTAGEALGTVTIDVRTAV
ncbi:MAG: lactonase family protein [Bryobacterales bacterium]|nr:lactonase family protein [Bryobacterales bacterium]